MKRGIYVVLAIALVLSILPMAGVLTTAQAAVTNGYSSAQGQDSLSNRGVTYYYKNLTMTETESVSAKYQTVTADLSAGVEVFNGGNPEWSGKATVRNQIIAEGAARSNRRIIAGINGAYPSGIVVKQGILKSSTEIRDGKIYRPSSNKIDPQNKGLPYLAIYRDSAGNLKTRVGASDRDDLLVAGDKSVSYNGNALVEAIGGNILLVDNGTIMVDSDNNGKTDAVYDDKYNEAASSHLSTERQPRTCVGIKDNTIIAVTVGCQRNGAEAAGKRGGATILEAAEIMKNEGCQYAINLDGGGSTTMVVNDVVKNDLYDYDSTKKMIVEREVGGSLLFAFNESSAYIQGENVGKNVDKIISSRPKTVNIRAGETAEFTVTANNAKSYQWQVFKSAAQTWYNVGSDANGPQTANLSFTTKAGHSGNIYRCKVTDNNGTVVYSGKALLTVFAPMEITKQPTDMPVILSGETVTFSVTATNASRYQWQVYKGADGT